MSILIISRFGPAKSWSFANGQNVTRAFDLDGRMTGNAVASSIIYDAASRLTGLTLGGVNVLTGNRAYSYDTLDRLTGFSDGTTPIGYAYDATGNRLSHTVRNRGQTTVKFDK